MIEMSAQERYVAGRFDARSSTFRRSVERDDGRAAALLSALGNLRGRLVLDLGCGKGRFGALLGHGGAQVVGLDLSSRMLGEAGHLAGRVRASARRLPFASNVFDAVIAVEVLQHLPRPALDLVFHEAARVLKPRGQIAIIDRNAWALNDRRPWLPAALVKWIDERRGRWMYAADAPVRERWFGPRPLANRLSQTFSSVHASFPLVGREADGAVFRWLPPTRSFVIWTGRAGETPS